MMVTLLGTALLVHISVVAAVDPVCWPLGSVVCVCGPVTKISIRTNE